MLENRLDFLRFFLYAVLVVLSLFLYQAWEREHANATSLIASQTISNDVASNRLIPVPTVLTESPVLPKMLTNTVLPAKGGQFIQVKTDRLQMKIDTVGGNIVETKLLDYKQNINSDAPVLLMLDQPNNRYIAESGLLSETGPDTASDIPIYKTDASSYQLSSDQKELSVQLHWQKNDILVTKRFTFYPHSYEVNVSYDVENRASTPWSGRLFTQFLRTNTPPETSLSSMIATYFGAAISSPTERFHKISFKEMKDKPIEQSIQGGWAAMIQHYFVGSWIPPKDQVFNYYSKVAPDNLYVLGMVGPNIAAPANGHAFFTTKLYAGPAIAEYLEHAAPGLKLTIDYGWFWFIADIIFWMMEKIHDLVGNWGLSIILVTVIIKILFYYLSAKSYRSMSALKQLQPRIEQLKKQYAEDKQKLTQATLDLYRQEKVNPMSGCLPIVIQIPVFIALYWVLVESVQLRQAPFYFWIHDLSQSDPYYVLPILMGLSMFLQQRLNPPPPDPMQAKMMMMMPVIFTALFFNFPSGLMLYWIVNNTLSFLQQWYIMRTYHPETGRKKTVSK